LDLTVTTLLTKERKNTSSVPGKIASVITRNKTIDELLGCEYLLTNTRGGYSSGTIVGCNTRRYHGLLIGVLDPPANRILGLSNLLETVIIAGRLHHLSTFEFPGSDSEDDGKFSPEGYGYIGRFTRDTGVHFDYRLNGIEMTKSIYLSRNDDIVLVQYDFKAVEKGFDFILRPFAALRDFHSLQKSYAPLCSAQLDGGLFICHDVPGSCELLINCQKMTYVKDPQWWFNFVYRIDRSRSQDFLEDLWTPGFYKCTINGPVKIVLKASLGNPCDVQQLNCTDIKTVTAELKKARQLVLAAAKPKNEMIRTLALAADQFICRRQTGRTTMLAGFPWFFDWGRDAFISLPGLLLATGRYEDARSVLTTFAAAADEGMIPNRFDDRSQTAYFNSIDASLWFINAAFGYLKTTGDKTTFTEQLLPVILQIIESYSSGTRFGISADTDGLITGGSEETQLTWMDAKFGGTAFTPRHGKAVEVNALWYNALCKLSKFYAGVETEKANRFDKLAKTVGRSFIDLFWNEKSGYLNDCVYPDGTVDMSCRCNQILAVSLEFSPLTAEQQKKIVEVVWSELLTPYGLRSLSPKDAKYKGTYSGPQYQRDESYHQGTVWAWLMGPFVEAHLKVNGFSPPSRQEAQGFVRLLVEHLTAQGCLGSISEIFDGEPPHEPKGCFAQAWSVAELIRAIELINS
jgi:predicted glycogen debranching enzyme